MIFSNLSFGIYYPGKSLLHRLQARTKLLILIGMIVVLALANRNQWHFLPYEIAGIIVVMGIGLSGLSPWLIWRQMWLLLLLAAVGSVPTLLFPGDPSPPLAILGPYHLSYSLVAIIVLVLLVLVCAAILPLFPIKQIASVRRTRLYKVYSVALLLFVPLLLSLFSVSGLTAEHTFLQLNPIQITYIGVWLIMPLFVVFPLVFSFSLLLTMTTEPIALIEGISLLLRPLRWLHLPVDDFSLMLLLALRFIPTFTDELDQLIKAQMARGSSVTYGSLGERIQSITMLFVPLMQGIFRRSEDLATALDARGYQVSGQQTLLHENGFTTLDYVVLVVVLGCLVGSLFA